MFRRTFRRWKAKLVRDQLKKHRKFLDEVREKFVDHLFGKEPTLIDAFAKQIRILKDRRIIAVFMTEDLYRSLLQKFVQPTSVIDDIVSTVKSTGEPVGFIGNIPIYINTLLEKAPIFVVGEIKWELAHVGDKN